MTTSVARLQHAPFPPDAPPLRPATEGLQRVTIWRNVSVGLAVALTAVLALGGVHLAYFAGATCGLVVATLLALGSHLARESRLTTLVVHHGFEHLPSVGRKHRRLMRAGRRQTLARELRAMARLDRSPAGCRLDIRVPVLVDRIENLRAELVGLATALEQAVDPDPVSVALIRELLRDGASPLYNPNLPADALHLVLVRASGGLKQ